MINDLCSAIVDSGGKCESKILGYKHRIHIENRCTNRPEMNWRFIAHKHIHTVRSKSLRALVKLFLLSIFLILYAFHYKLHYQHNNLTEKKSLMKLTNLNWKIIRVFYLVHPPFVLITAAVELPQFHKSMYSFCMQPRCLLILPLIQSKIQLYYQLNL